MRYLNLAIVGFLLFAGFTSQAQIVFSQEYGGAADEDGRWMEQMPDSGFIMVGGTETYSIGQSDVWMVRTDLYGNVLWSRSYGTALFDFANMVKPTRDGGFIVAGFTPGSYGDNDAWIFKTNSTGGLQWSKATADTGVQELEAIVQTTDGGFAAVGVDYSPTTNYYDMLVVRYDSLGNTLWTQHLGGASFELGNSIQQTPDGGFIINGISYSYGLADGDYILYKLDANGQVQWYKNYSTPGLQEPHYVQLTRDGGYIMVGDADDLANTLGQTDIWVIKTNSIGDTLWTKVLGGSKKDGGKTIEPTTDGGYIIGGITRSYGLINPNFYLGKLDSLGNVEWENTSYGSAYHDHAYRAIQCSDGGYANFGYFRNASAIQNYALVKVGPDGGVTKDVAIDNFLAPSANMCRGFGVPITLQITNYGAVSESNIPVSLTVSNATTTTTIYDTLRGSIGPALTRTITFAQTVDFLQNGNYTLTASIRHIANDISYVNDTSYLTVTVEDPASSPTTNGAVSCNSAPLQLSATAATPSDSIFWYNAAGAMVGSGVNFITDTLATSATYYAESQRGKGYTCGPVDNTFGAGSATSSDGYLLFDTRIAFKLVSVRVYAAMTGVRIIELRNSAGTVLQSKTVNLPIGWSRVYLNFDVPQATDLQLGLGTGSQPLFRNTSGVTFPYGVSRVVEIYGAYPSLSRYYYFYDWNIFVPYQQCTSGRVPALAQIGTGATTAFDRSRCGSGTVTLTANSTDPLSWYTASTGGVQVGSGSSFTTPVLATSNTYYLQAGTCPNRIAVQAIVNNVSAAPVTTGGNNCGPGRVTLSATSTDPVTWYDAPSNGNAYGTGLVFQTPYLNSTATFYAVAGTTCPSAAVPAVATINAATAPVGFGASACSPASVTLSAQSVDPIQWFAAATGGSPLANGPVFTTPILAATTTYYAQALNTCPSVRTPVTATLISVPAPSGTDATHCGAGSVVLSATALDPITWWTASTGGSQVGSGSIFTTPNLTQTTVYYAQATNGACRSTRTPVTATITVTPPPVATDAGRCTPGTVTLTASSPDPIFWYDAATGGTQVGAGNTFTTPSLSVTTTYWVEAAAACPSARVPVQAVISTPVGSPTTSNSSICGPGNATLSGTPASPQDLISWYDAPVGGNLIGTGNSVTAPVTGTTTFYAIAGFVGCQSTPVPCVITVNALPASPTVNGDSRCGSGSITLTANSPLSIITWYDANGSVLSNGSSYTGNFSSTTVVYVAANDGLCYSQQVPVTATVNPLPNVNIGPDTISVLSGQQVTLNAGAGYISYLWSNNATVQSINVGTAGNYSVVVTDANGCTGSDQTYINITTGISNTLAQADMTVYPNPSNGLVHVKGQYTGDLVMQVMDQVGQLISEETQRFNGSFDHTIRITNQPAGFYLLRLSSDTGSSTYRLIIQ